MNLPKDPRTEAWKRLGEATRASREEAGLTHREAAGLAHMSPTTWLKVESGEPVTPSTVARVERALGWVTGLADAIVHEATDIDDRLDVIERKLALVEGALLKIVRDLGVLSEPEISRLLHDAQPARVSSRRPARPRA